MAFDERNSCLSKIAPGYVPYQAQSLTSLVKTVSYEIVSTISRAVINILYKVPIRIVKK